MRYGSVLNLISVVILIVSFFLLLSTFVALYYKGDDFYPLLYSFLITFFSGGFIYLLTRKAKKEDLRHREGFLTVTLSWITIAFFGSIPYLLADTFGSFTDAYFESMAGFTTTGASVMTDIEANPKGILFWRSLTQWLGGMGIVLFSLAIMPLIGGGSVQLFKAEVPEITVEKLRPRLMDTAKSLWYIYTILTAMAALLYIIGGMSVFDSICHAFTTLATGGFSTKNQSIAHFGSAYIDAVATVFMFLAGVNYTLYFYAFRGNFSRFLRSDEFRFYLWVSISAIVLVTVNLWGYQYNSLLEAFRYASFQVISIMTTTGYATSNYVQWSYFAQILLVTLMFFGGMIGSTGGGMKQVRVLLMFRQAYRELYQLIHPRAVTVLRLDGRHVPKEILGSIWGFVFLFIILWVGGTLLLGMLGLDIITSASAVTSALCNVGPALGKVGPADNYHAIPLLGKWVLIFCMLTGRLEVYTVILLLVPHFWKK
jgi:trk system potassium uptake protein TrkH